MPPLFVTWQEPKSRRIYPIARLMRVPSGEYEFAYVRAALEAQRQGFVGLPGFEDPTQVYLSREFPALFEGRKVSRGRRLSLHGESGAAPANDVLDAAPITVFVPRPAGAPGAPPERLEVFAPPLPGVAEKYWGVFVIRGVGRGPRSAKLGEALGTDERRSLAANEALSLLREPGNVYNANALLVARADGTTLGYVPDYMVNELSLIPGAPERLSARLLAVHQLNFSTAQPLYQITCRYVCDAQLGQALFRSSTYEPLSSRASARPPEDGC